MKMIKRDGHLLFAVGIVLSGVGAELLQGLSIERTADMSSKMIFAKRKQSSN